MPLNITGEYTKILLCLYRYFARNYPYKLCNRSLFSFNVINIISKYNLQNETRPSEGHCQLQSRRSEVLCQNSRRSEGRPSGLHPSKTLPN